jgi:hypothetical protein
MPRKHNSTTLSRFVLSFIFAATLYTVPCVAQEATHGHPELTPSGSTSVVMTVDSAPLPGAPSTQTAGDAKDRPTTTNSYVFPSFRDRRRAYLTDLVGPGVFFSTVIQAAADQAQSLKVGYPSDGYAASGEHPAHGIVPEWGEGFDGYTKRYASRFGMGLVGTTSRYGLGELLHEDVSYHLCRCRGAFPRAYHAISQALIAHTGSGRSVPSLPAIASPFIGAEVATVAWYPARYNASDAIRTSLPLYFGLALKNMFKEFERH